MGRSSLRSNFERAAHPAQIMTIYGQLNLILPLHTNTALFTLFSILLMNIVITIIYSTIV